MKIRRLVSAVHFLPVLGRRIVTLAVGVLLGSAGCANLISDAASVATNRRVLNEAHTLSTISSTDAFGGSYSAPVDRDTALVFWKQRVGAGVSELYTQLIGPDGTRNSRVNLTASEVETVVELDVAHDGAGRVAVIYRVAIVPGFGSLRIYASVYDHNRGGTIETTELSKAAGLIPISGYPGIGFDSAGRILAAFVMESAAVESVFACLYEPDTGWCAAPVEIDTSTEPVSEDANIEVVATDDGMFHVVWAQDVGGTRSVMTRSLDPDTGSWSAITVHGVQEMDSARGNLLVPTTGSELYLFWGGPVTAPTRDLAVSRYTAESGWSTPELIDEDVAEFGMILGEYGSGEITVVYSREVGFSTPYLIRGTRGSWSTPLAIDSFPTSLSDYPTPTRDSQGGTVIIRIDQGPPVNVMLTRYTKSSGLGQDIEVDGSTMDVPYRSPSITTAPGGTVFFTYHEQTATEKSLLWRTITLE